MSSRRRRPRNAPPPALVIASLPLAAVLIAPRDASADPPSLLDRAVVAAATRHAIQRAGLASDGPRDLSNRARASGWVPDLSLRVRRGFGSSAALSFQTGDRVISDDSLILDARLTFALDRVVFAPAEVAIARLEIERIERRAQLEREVIDLLATMEHARLALLTQDTASPEGQRSNLEFARARARLESLTGVAFNELVRAR